MFGCDTETYYDGKDKGLKSIQLYNPSCKHYITTDDWNRPDDEIRYDICEQFFKILSCLNDDALIAFFNINFDVSQFLYYMVAESGYHIVRDTFYLKKYDIQILETERKIYQIKIRTPTNHIIKMIDIANFLVGVTLDNACKSWIHESKIELETKKFEKRPATVKEREYAVQDAILTYKLLCELIKESVIESKSVTIAGRTMEHFKAFLYDKYNLSLNEYFYRTEDVETVKGYQEQFELELRYGVRGGICQAWKPGIHEHCIHIDARSMYPTQCVKPYHPIGPILQDKPSGPHTSIVYPSGYYTLKKRRIPCVQWQRNNDTFRYQYLNHYDAGDFVLDFALDGSYPIWSDEYELIRKNYDVREETIDKTWFIEMTENRILKEYVDELYIGKQTNTGSKKLYYKYLLNALYGKFLTRPDGVTIEYVQDYDGWHRVKTASLKRMYYLPLGSWIAMQGRVTLFNAINSIDPDDFVYCDTDSMIFTGDKMPDVRIGNNLGDWGIEQEDVTVNCVGPKTYQELIKEPDRSRWITKCGGLPTKDKDSVYWGQLREGLTVKTSKPRRDLRTWAINFEPVDYTVNTRAYTFRRS